MRNGRRAASIAAIKLRQYGKQGSALDHEHGELAEQVGVD